MRPPARHPGRSRRVTSPTQPHGCQRRTAEGGTHRQGHSTKSLRQSGPPIRSAKLRPPTASGRQSRCRVSRHSDRKPSMNPVRLAHSANPLRQVAPQSRSANQVRQAESAKRQGPAKPPPSFPALGSETVDGSRSTRPLRQLTPPSRSANQVRQAETANRQRPAKPPPSLPALGSEAVDESRSTRPHRHRTTPSHSAKLVRQAKGAKLRPPAAGEAAAGFQHSDRKPSMNPVPLAHSANSLRHGFPTTRSLNPPWLMGGGWVAW